MSAEWGAISAVRWKQDPRRLDGERPGIRALGGRQGQPGPIRRWSRQVSGIQKWILTIFELARENPIFHRGGLKPPIKPSLGLGFHKVNHNEFTCYALSFNRQSVDYPFTLSA